MCCYNWEVCVCVGSVIAAHKITWTSSAVLHVLSPTPLESRTLLCGRVEAGYYSMDQHICEEIWFFIFCRDIVFSSLLRLCVECRCSSENRSSTRPSLLGTRSHRRSHSHRHQFRILCLGVVWQYRHALRKWRQKLLGINFSFLPFANSILGSSTLDHNDQCNILNGSPIQCLFHQSTT